MSQVLVTESYLDDIADAIREKNGSEDTYTPAQMAGAIEDIHTADEVVLVSKSVTTNGTYNPASDSADGYSGVTVNVPNTYTVSDNGKVVVNQALTDQTSKSINANGTHDTTANNSVVVDVPNSYAAADEGKVVSSGGLVAQTSRNVTVNGTYDTTENNAVVVNVQCGGGGNGNTVIDESEIKNTSGGTFTFSKSATIQKSGQYKITAVSYANNLSITVNGVSQPIDIEVSSNYVRGYSQTLALSAGDIVEVSSSGTGKCLATVSIVDLGGVQLVPKNITQNGTYNPADDNADGYSQVTVNVSGGGEYSLSFAEYLQFYGTSPGQIIELPYTVSSDYEIEVDFEVTETSSNNSVIGNSNGYNKPHLTVFNNKWYTSTGGNDLNFGNSSMLTGRHTVVINKNGNSVLFDEQVVLSNLSNKSYQDVYLWVGGRYSSSGYTLAKAKIYEYKITSISTGNVICDLKPAEIKKNNNVVIIGLYDVINDVFYK